MHADIPDLALDQADMVFGTCDGPDDEDALREFFETSLADYLKAFDALQADVATLTDTEAHRRCHTQSGSLRTLGLERAGQLFKELETTWPSLSPEARLAVIDSARLSVSRGRSAALDRFPFLANAD